jgi:coenzyme A diphosphatase NUDT7
LLLDKIKSLKGRQARILGHEDFLKTAVLVPVVYANNEICLLLEKRSSSLRRAPGEICFPGGEVDPDDNYPEKTALRECCEELGIPPHQIEIIASLDVMISPFNIIVSPFLAFINDISDMHINKDEVETVLLIPLKFFFEHEPEIHYLEIKAAPPGNYPFHLIPKGKDYPFRSGRMPHYFYIFEGHVIWGLTAFILHHFIDLLQEP